MSENKKRVFLFDNLKAFLIILVVIGHFLEECFVNLDEYKSIVLFIYSFHMPLFIMISGHFHKNNHILKKVISYVAIGYVLKIIFFLYNYYIRQTAPIFYVFSENGLPWYMFVLAFYIFVTYVFRNIDKKYLILISIVAACIAGYNVNIGNFLCLSRIIVFYPFYLIGQYISTDNILKLNKNRILKLLSIVIVTICIVMYFIYYDDLIVLKPLFTGKHSYFVNDLFVTYGPLYRLLMYFISCSLSVFIVCLIPNRFHSLLSNIGKNTLQIYFWHYIFLYILIDTRIMNYIFSLSEGGTIWFLCSIITTVILSLKIFRVPVKNIISLCQSL